MQINSGAKAPVRPIAYEASQENERVKYFRVLKDRKSHPLAFLFLVVLDEACERAIESRGGLRTGRPLVIDAGNEGSISFAQRLDRRERVLIGQFRMTRGELGDGEGQAGEERFALVNEV